MDSTYDMNEIFQENCKKFFPFFCFRSGLKMKLSISKLNWQHIHYAVEIPKINLALKTWNYGK